MRYIRSRSIKPIETEYKGYRFRSRLEARWAVFFDVCGVRWEYEPEGYDLGDGIYYLPDFLLHGVVGRDGGDLWVEVKGWMTDDDAVKIRRFAELGHKVLVVGPIPDGETADQIDSEISDRAYNDRHGWPNEFNFRTIDGDYFAAHPGVNSRGGFELFGDDSSYMLDRNDKKTEEAYRIARQARFEHGEKPI